MATNCVRWALYESTADDYEDVVLLAALADYASQAGEVTVATVIVTRRLGMPLDHANDAVRRLKDAGLVRVDGRGNVTRLCLRARRRRSA